jgi:hypothetical protein
MEKLIYVLKNLCFQKTMKEHFFFFAKLRVCQIPVLGKDKVELCLIKHYIKKTDGGVEV